MTMFYVRHHNDEVTVLNAKCPTALLMDRLRKLAGDSISPDAQATTSVDLVPVSGVDGSPPVGAPAGAGGGGGGGSKSQSHPLLMHERCEHNGATVYANTFIASRGTYALLLAQEDEDGVRVLKPLWRSPNDEADRLAAALDSRAADERKKLGSKKNQRK